MTDFDRKKSVQKYFHDNLRSISLEKIVGVGGLALLSALALLSFAAPGVSLSVAAASLLGGIGANVLASLIQQQYQFLLDQPDQTELDKIRTLANALEVSIQQDGNLRQEIDRLLEACDAIAIATETTKENLSIHEWLLNEIKQSIEQYHTDFVHLKTSNAQILSLVTDTNKSVSQLLNWNLEEKGQLLDELKTALEKGFLSRIESMADLANRGYGEPLIQNVESLIAELENAETKTSINVELKARAYRLAANLFLPNKPNGNLQKCQIYLSKAQGLSTEENRIKCQILNAFLLYCTHGSQVALALLENVRGDEALRLRFGLNLENGVVSKCATILSQVDRSKLQSPDWQRSLMLYYGAIGDRANLESIIVSLLVSDPPADLLEIAGLALSRIAFKRFGEFCEKHNVCPGFHIELDLDDLVDQQIVTKASEHFSRAANLYEAHKCPKQAARALVAAIRLREKDLEEKDSVQSDLKHQLERLHRLDPLYPLGNPHLFDNKTNETGQNPLVSLTSHPDLDMALMINLRHYQPSGEEEVLASTIAFRQLIANENTNEIAKVLLAAAGFQLWQQFNDNEKARGWLLEVPLPSKYEHIRLLLEYGYYAINQPAQAESILQTVLEKYPEHPEVLALAAKHYRRYKAHPQELDCARRLHTILRTSQTVRRLLDALIANSQLEEFLNLAETSTDLQIPETSLHSGQAYALRLLDRPQDVLKHLEWLRKNKSATVDELINLSRIYQLFQEPTKAIGVLSDCIDQFPNEPTSYIEIAQIYLDLKRPRDAFKWAVQAREKFPNDPHVGLNLIGLSFTSGFEAQPQVQEAFQELIPGGRLSHTGLIKTQTIEATVEFLKNHNQRIQELENLYRQGTIPSILLCYALNTPLFQFHSIAIHTGSPRYVAVGDQGWQAEWIKSNNPSEVVLDYSAILTLWSLYKERWVEKVKVFFEKIWIPEKVLWLTFWEQKQFTHLGQQSRYIVQKRIQRYITSLPKKFIISPRQVLPNGWDATGEFTETKAADDLDIPYLNEYTLKENKSIRRNFGFHTLAKILRDNGEISPEIFEQLVRHSTPASVDADDIEIKKGDDVVVSLFTLEQIITADAFDAVCRFFGLIYISEPATEQLNRDVFSYERNDEMRDEITALRQSLIDAAERKDVRWATIGPDQRWLSKETLTTSDIEGDTNSTFDALWKVAIAYFDQLIGKAHFHQIPIWTDDRWTSRLYADIRKPPHFFGTAEYLEWARSKTGLNDEYFDLYSKLINYRYKGLCLHPEYLTWVLSNIPNIINSHLIQAPVDLYRIAVLESWELVLKHQTYSAEIGTRIFSVYNRNLVSFAQQCFHQKMEFRYAAKVFKQLDLGHYAPQIKGRESNYYASLLLDTFIIGNVILNDQTSRLYLSEFNQWFDQVLLESGVTSAALEDAWYTLLHYPLELHQSAQTDAERDVAAIFAERMLFAAPNYITEYILRTDLAKPLRDIFGFEAKETVFFEFVKPDGMPIRVHIPADKWQHDLDQATTDFILNPESAATKFATATIRGKWKSPGSMFLLREIIPTSVLEQHPEAKGRHMWVLLLPSLSKADPQVRLAIWQQALRKLEIAKENTESWLALQPDLLSNDEVIWGSTSSIAITTILGYKNILRDYLQEGLSLGAAPTNSILQLITPDAVRRWINMPELDWQEETGLIKWAKTQLEIDMPVLSDNTTSLPGMAFSIFPDSNLWIEKMGEQLAAKSASLNDVCLELISTVDQYTSRTVKSNVIAAVLVLISKSGEDELKHLTADTSEKIVKSIKNFIGAQPNDAPSLSEFFILESRLLEFFYTKWSLDAQYIKLPAIELAYLALNGASFVVESLSRSSKIKESTIEHLANQIILNTKQICLLAQKRPAYPRGFFRPSWSLVINYQFSHLIHFITYLSLEVLDAFSFREMFLDISLHQRLVQVRLNNLNIEPAWSDGALVIDVGQSIRKLWQDISPEKFKEIDTGVQQKFLACASDMNEQYVTAFRDRWLNSSDEKEILLSIILAFLSVDTEDGWEHIMRSGILTLEGIEHVEKFPESYMALVSHLAEHLALQGDLPEGLIQMAHKIVFEPSSNAVNRYALLTAQAVILSRLAGYSLKLDEIVQWLSRISDQSKDDVEVFRCAVKPFLEIWTTYSTPTRNKLREVFSKMSQQSHLTTQWETRYLCRELI